MSAGVADLLPLGPSQQAMLAEEIRHPGRSTNRVHVSGRLVGPLDTAAFARAWQDVVDRHVCLRSAFAWERLRDPVQVVHRGVAAPLAFDATDDPTLWRRTTSAEHAVALSDPRRAPLVRMAVATGPDGDHHLLWSYHHLVLDGWSSALVMRELLAQHDALVRGAPSPLGPPAAYEAAVDRWREAGRDREATGHWQRRLAGLRPALDRGDDDLVPLPASEHRPLSSDLAARLDAFGRRNRLTLSTLVHGAWAQVLAARAGAAEVLLGSVDAGRDGDLPGVERIVGPLLRTVPVRVSAGAVDTASLAELQRRLHADARHAEGLDWPSIAAAAGLPGRARFDSLVTVESYPDRLWQDGTPLGSLSLADVTVTETPAAMLVLEAVPTDQGPVMRLVHDRGRVDDITAAGLLDDLVASLDVIAEGQPRPTPVNASPPAHDTAITPRETLATRWQRTAATHAQRVAVSDLHARLTYAQTDRAARALAAALGPVLTVDREHAARADGDLLVGVLVTRAVDLPIAILGVLLAGAAYVPLDPGAPSATLQRIVQRCGLSAIVVDGTTAPRVADLAVPLVDVTVPAPDVPAQVEGGRTRGAGRRRAEDAAYVIHTSGSTGVPKGVVVTHRNVLRLLDRAAEVLPVSPDDVWSCLHSAAFDFSVWELFGALLSGGEVVVLPDWVARDPQALVEHLEARRVTVLSSTPTAFAALADGASPAQVDALAVRRVVFGGEALDVARILPWQRLRGPRTEWVNMYGITETTVHVTARRVDAIGAELARDSCLGMPLGDLRLDLVDGAGATMGPGEVGELHVAGAGVARGYLDDPRGTADRFRPDPYASVPGARRYRTGDLAIQLPGGELGYRGRADRQVKIRGHRVEPGELEAVFAAHPGVGSAAVAADADGQLRAWVTPGEAAAPCRRLLHEAEVTGAVVVELGELAVLHRNVAEARFTGDEVLAGAYLGPGLHLEPGDTVLDVGANAGVFASWVALRQPGVHLHCVEPLADVADLLRRNLAAHAADAKVHQVAAGAAEGIGELTYYPHATVLSGGVDGRLAAGAWLRGRVPGDAASLVDDLLDTRLSAQTVEVPVTRLSTLIRDAGLDRIDLLKVDVEGAELAALVGLAEEDWPRVRRLAVEVHGRDRAGALAEELRGRGFWVAIEQEAELAGTDLVMLHARTPEALAVDRSARDAQRDPASPPVKQRVWHSPAALERDLRAYVTQQLPGQLHPRSLRLVADLPRTSSGKLDTVALLAATGEGPADVVTPTSGLRPGAESELVAAWTQVLDARAVDPDTDFFAAGGDSILCLTMLARLRERGWALTPRQVFELRTPGRLADVARPLRVDAEGLDDPGAPGPVPLTPIQRWFLALDVPDRSHWNQTILVRLPEGAEPERVRMVLQDVADQHDAFRLRLHRRGERWEQNLVAEAGPIGWSVLDSADDLATVHGTLDVTAGPMLAAALVGDGRQLLLVAHHLVIDAHSWSIVLRELAVRLAAGQGPEAPVPTTPSMSFRRWAEDVAPHIPPPAAPDSGLGPESAAQRRRFTLDHDTTALLAAPLYHRAALGPAELTLAALAYAAAGIAGGTQTTIEIERHGRDDPRTLGTVGWFTRFDLVTIAVPASDDPIDLVHASARSLRRTGVRTQAVVPALTFNFVGETAGAAGPLTVLDTEVGPLHDPRGGLPRRLTVEAGVRDGHLVCTLIADRSVPAVEIEALVAGTRGTLDALAQTARHTPTAPILDLPRADLTAAELEPLSRAVPDLADAYPLTDVQAGLLFHTLFEGRADPYVNQFHWTLEGDLDLAALAEAWRRTALRHPVLRTGVWTRSRRPHQVVHATATPLHRASPGTSWVELAQAERAAVAAAGALPLSRLAVIPAGPGRHRVVWTHHHLVIDGWSAGTVLSDLHQAYSALVAGRPEDASPAALPPSFGEWVTRLDERDPPVAGEWRDQLVGAAPALLLAHGTQSAAAAQPSLVHREPTSVQAAAVEAAQRRGLTLNTLALAAWALALAPQCGPDVVIGNTVSGRSGGPDGYAPDDLEAMVGMLVNTLPIRVRLLPEMDVRTWLAAVQTVAVQAREHEHVPLARILRWVGADPAAPLFDTSVVVENLPEQTISRRPVPGLTVSEVGSRVHNHYAATLRVVPRPTLALELLHDTTRLPAPRATALLDRTCAALAALAEASGQPGRTLGATLDSVADWTPLPSEIAAAVAP